MLYRQRLQVERDLRAGAMAGEAVVGASTPGTADNGVVGLLEEIGDWLELRRPPPSRSHRTNERAVVVDRLAGPQWRWAARIAAMGALATWSACRARVRVDETRTSRQETAETAEAAAG